MADQEKEEIEYSDEESGGDEFRSRVKRLKDDIAACRKEKEEYLEGWKRAKADYINVEKESRLREERTGEYMKVRVLGDFIDILDQLDQAFDSHPPEETPWTIGIGRIRDNLHAIVSRYGIEAVGTVGEVFDPRMHEAIGVEQVTDEAADDTIAQVLQKGYKMGEVTLRPAKVKVAKFEI
ncbi:MAG: nucleotide exchange factor GrpE [Patescibacteria group bacterium]